MEGQGRQVVRRDEVRIDLEMELREGALRLWLVDWEKMNAGTLVVDQNYIDAHLDMRSFFPSPQHLQYTLAELFNTLPLTKNSITLQFSLSAAKINVQKEYILELREDMSRQQQMLRSQLQMERSSHKEIVSSFRRQIAELQEKLAVRNSTVSQLEEKIRQMERQLKESSSQQVALLAQNQQIKEHIGTQIATLQQKLEQDSTALQETRGAVCEKEGLLSKLENKLKQKQRIEERRLRCVREDNPHLMCFYAFHSKKEVTFTKRSQNGWGHVALGWAVAAETVEEVEVEAVALRDGSVAIGVGSQTAMGSNSYKVPSLLTYFFRDGTVTAAGCAISKSSRRIQKGDVVKLKLDRRSSRAIWTVQGETVGEGELGGLARASVLFFFLTMFWKGDALRVAL